MTKSIAIVATSLALAASMVNPDFAQGAGNREYIANLQDECEVLIRQFDAAKSDNTEAKALRKKAFDNCANSNMDQPETGIKQIKQALELIGGKSKAK